MAKTLIKYRFVLKLFLLIEVSAYSADKTCNNGSSLFKLEKAGSRRLREECCFGYRQKVSNESTVDTTWLKCVPICIPACKNGTCQAPGVCSCETGFKPDPEQENNCIPHCSDGCRHGTCVSPEQCLCYHGYQYDLDEELCQPVCTEPCHNGTCVSPENCQCYPGYRKSDTNECLPYCSVGCEHGHCIGPDHCVCDPGWSHYNRHFVFYPGECFKIALAELSTVKSSTDGKITITIDWTNDAITSTKIGDYDLMDDKHETIASDSDKTNLFIIIGALLFIACLIFLVILVVKWTKLLQCIQEESYVIEDKDLTDINLDYLDK